jgi:hypothetical protein
MNAKFVNNGDLFDLIAPDVLGVIFSFCPNHTLFILKNTRKRWYFIIPKTLKINAYLVAKDQPLDIVKWYIECGSIYLSILFSGAAHGSHIDTMSWLKSRGCPSVPAHIIMAAHTDNINVIKWLIDNFQSLWKIVNGNHDNLSIPISNIATERGYLHVLKWLKENNYPLSSLSVLTAAKNGHLDVIQWFVDDLGYTLSYIECRAAYSMGFLNIIRWLVSVKKLWYPSLTKDPDNTHHCNILNWLHYEADITCCSLLADDNRCLSTNIPILNL